MNRATQTASEVAEVLPQDRQPRVLIVGDPDKPDAVDLAPDLEDWLGERADVLGVELMRTYKPIEQKPDLVIVLGGDGAMLAVSHRLGKRRVPVMGVNVGKVGFLAGVAPDGVYRVLEELLEGHGHVENRAMMNFQVRREGKVVLDSHVLNEIVVSRGAGRSMVEVDFIDERRLVCTYGGDGVIVATATGSTAYNLSAGGPILSPRLDAFVISPLAPYMLGMRPLVLPGDRNLSLKVRGPGLLTSDGHLEGKLKEGDLVRVGPSPRRFLLVVDPQNRFYARLRKKLRWGESPGPG